jgi:hypothetical protein
MFGCWNENAQTQAQSSPGVLWVPIATIMATAHYSPDNP